MVAFGHTNGEIWVVDIMSKRMVVILNMSLTANFSAKPEVRDIQWIPGSESRFAAVRN
jgi:hypothetical protein